MQGETEGKKHKRRKKKSKFWYRLYAVVILLLTITNVTLATLLLTHVQSIQVTGTENSQKNEIISWIKEDSLTSNSFYAWLKFKTGSYDLPIYLEDVDVSFLAPWKLKVKVTEKQIAGCLLDDNAYVYFDAEGLVLKKAAEHDEEVPFIEGLQVEESQKYEFLQMENEKVLDYFVSVTKVLEKKQLNPDRIVWEEGSMNLYFEQICVKLGKSNFSEKITQLTATMINLEGKSGILHLEHYTSDSKYFSFEEEQEEIVEENTENI